MSGQRGHQGSKPAREIFLTSSSLSFSSLSSSSASWDDAIELNTKAFRTAGENEKGKLLKAPSRGSEMSCVTDVQPAPSPPSRLRPLQLMSEGLETHYDSERIPASVFGKTGDLNWSEISNESLFSLRMSNFQAFRQSNIKLEEVLMFGDAKEKRSEVKETKSGVTSVETNTHREKSSSSTTPVVSLSTKPNSFDPLYKAPPTKVQSLSTPVGEKKSKKRKKTRKSKKSKTKKKEKKEKKKQKKRCCCIWSWLFSGLSKCEFSLCCCYKWKKCGCCCCRGPKAMVL